MGNKGCGEQAEGAHVAAAGFLPPPRPPQYGLGPGAALVPALVPAPVPWWAAEWKSFWPPTVMLPTQGQPCQVVCLHSRSATWVNTKCMPDPAQNSMKKKKELESVVFLNERSKSIWSPWTPNYNQSPCASAEYFIF